jgi:alkylhydroperoxidase/carboxymuconolactone decarboxylase family protein YurZ
MSKRDLTLSDIRAEALAALSGTDDGESLDESTAALLRLAVRVAAIDATGTRRFTERALDAGATAAQVTEALVLVSGIWMHALLEGCLGVGEVLRERGDPAMVDPLDERRAELWKRRVEEDPYWSNETPAFVEPLLRLTPDAYEAFFVYCAVPWKTRALELLTKELIALSVDATATHRYLPGVRMHVAGAMRLGAGRAAILETLDIAADAPGHRGVR